MYCRKCGKEIYDNSKFCAFCGAKIEKNEEIEDSGNVNRLEDATASGVTGGMRISGKTVLTRVIAVILGAGIVVGSGYTVAKTPEIREKLGIDSKSKMEEALPTKEEKKDSFAEIFEDKEKKKQEEKNHFEPDMHSVFRDMPQEGFFCSGVGAWQTGIQLEEDGSFTGQFTDGDLGITGPDYPNGSIFICNFKGKFSVPEKIEDHIYKTRLVDLETEGKAGEEYIKDGYKYIYSDAYGLNGKEYIIYEPGIPIDELPEELVGWMSLLSEKTEILSYYVLYNVTVQTPFFFM